MSLKKMHGSSVVMTPIGPPAAGVAYLRPMRVEVAPVFPDEGPVDVLIVGEAPGPRGALISGVPFWGDWSGKLVYGALADARMAKIPAAALAKWNGKSLTELRPTLAGAALTNAVSFCPMKKGRACPPSQKQLMAPKNRRRVLEEIRAAAARSRGKLRVIALGRKAQTLLKRLRPDAPPIELLHLKHPSWQALAPGGRGSMAVRERQWQKRLVRLLLR